MEEEIKEESKPKKKRSVSLFKRRKKSEIRPFVKEKKKREYKKILFAFFIFTFFIFILSAFLYFFRIFVVPNIFQNKSEVISPQGNAIPDDDTIQKTLLDSGLKVSNIKFQNDASIVVFTLNGRTQILLSRFKNIKDQLELIEAIDRQVTADGKQAISIDLRYNKPIVKF